MKQDMNQINLVHNDKISDVTANQLSVVLGLFLSNHDISDTTNEDSIIYLKTNTVEDIIFSSTKSFFNKNINNFSNIITTETTDEDFNSNIREFLEDYKSLYFLCPNEFRNSFLEKFRLNENDFEAFKKSMLNEETKELTTSFLSRIASNIAEISKPEELKEVFDKWISEWDTKKLLEKNSISNFSKKYEVFFKYLEEVLLKCEKTEITSDIKNYVESNWMFNDFFSIDKKDNSETLSKLNEYFNKYENKTITEEEIIESNKLFEMRLRETSLFIKVKTNDTNDLATLNVNLVSANYFINEKPSNEAFYDCHSHIMTSGYLDRCRVNAFSEREIFISDSKSFEILGNSDRKDIDRDLLAALILSKTYKVNYSLISPSMYPSKENFDFVKSKISKSTENHEIEAVQNLFLLSKIYSLKKIIDTSDLDLSFSKTDIGFSNGTYKKIANIDVVDVVKNSLTFFQKNNDYLNTDKNRALLRDFSHLLQSVYYSAEVKDLSTLKDVFCSINKEHIINIVENNRWMTDDTLENAIRFYFNPDHANVIKENETRNDKYKKHTIIKQEQIELLNIEKKLKDLDINNYHKNIIFDPIMKKICTFISEMYEDTYKGKTNNKKESLLSDHLLATKFGEKYYEEFADLYSHVGRCFTSKTHYITSISSAKWKNLDKTMLHYYKINFSKKSKDHSFNLINLLNNIIKDYDSKNNSILERRLQLDYEPAQAKYITKNLACMHILIDDIRNELKRFKVLEKFEAEKNNEKKDIVLNDLKNMQVHPENAKIKETIILKNSEHDKKNKTMLKI